MQSPPFSPIKMLKPCSDLFQKAGSGEYPRENDDRWSDDRWNTVRETFQIPTCLRRDLMHSSNQHGWSFIFTISFFI